MRVTWNVLRFDTRAPEATSFHSSAGQGNERVIPAFYSKMSLSANVVASGLLKHCSYSVLTAQMLPRQWVTRF